MLENQKILKVVLRWLLAWSALVDGVIGVLTFGFWIPCLRLEAARLYARKVHRFNSKL